MSEPLSDDYLEGMRAHVENGGTLYHRNGLDLLVEVDRLRSALATAEAAALERAAQLVEQVARDDDTSEIGDRAADAFNTGDRRPMADRLRDWNAVIAEGIRALAQKEPQK